MYNVLFITSLIVILLSGLAVGDDFNTESKIPFCKGGVSQLRLDYVQPQNTTEPTPGLIMVHGGAWMIGKRGDYAPFMEQLAGEGVFVATVDYRHTIPWTSEGEDLTQPGAQFPAQIEDVKCAVRWLRANAAKYHVDPNRIAIFGASAGGHLSLLAGLTEGGKFEGTGGYAGVSSKVAAVVDWFGPSALYQDYYQLPDLDLSKSLLVANKAAGQLAMSLLLGGRLRGNVSKYREASPIEYVNSKMPPLFIAHGEADPLVPIGHSLALLEAIESVGGHVEFQSYPGANHGFANQPSALTDALERSIQFINNVFN